MATIHVGCLPGPFEFARTVAIKELHKHLLGDPSVLAMFVDEARLASKINHPNVVPVLDVVHEGSHVYLVMEYVHGESLARALAESVARHEPIPPAVVSAIVIDGLRGLHAAHELADASGSSLGLVHRDVSPQNLLIGADGLTRLVDFGIAKARDRIFSTQGTELRGKVPYMAPEQVLSRAVDHRADLWAAGVVLWEALTGRSLFATSSPGGTIRQILEGDVAAPSSVDPTLACFDALMPRILTQDPNARFDTAAAFADAIAAACFPATAAEVGKWLERVSGKALAERRALCNQMEAALRGRTEDRARSESPVQGTASSRSSADVATAVSIARSVVASPPLEASSDARASGERNEDAREPSAAPAPPTTRARRWWVLASGLLVAAAALGGRLLTSSAVEPGAAPLAAAAAPAPTPSAKAITSDGAVEELAAGATPLIAPTHKTAGTTPRPSQSRVPASVSATRTAPPLNEPPDCSPPYTIGPAPDFIKRPKRECL